jgi:glycosyltransferase involved in cell wall biosynthesis
MVGSPEGLIAISNWGWSDLLFHFHGVSNPLVNSRYAVAKWIAGSFDRRLFRALSKTDAVIASADSDAIDGLVARSKGSLQREKITFQPTVINTTIFKPGSAVSARQRLGLPEHGQIVLFCGRLNWVKGWDLVLSAFALWSTDRPNGKLCFVGDGEDRAKLESQIRSRKLREKVLLVGWQAERDVAEFVRAADLVVLGSHDEGWPHALVEAVACEKPIVTTNVSGSRRLVRHGENGFVVASRCPKEFAYAMSAALELDLSRSDWTHLVEPYSIPTLVGNLGRIWGPFRECRACASAR